METKKVIKSMVLVESADEDDHTLTVSPRVYNTMQSQSNEYDPIATIEDRSKQRYYNAYLLDNKPPKVGDLCLVQWGFNSSGTPLFDISVLDKIGSAGIHYFYSMNMCFGQIELKAVVVVASSNPKYRLPLIPTSITKEIKNRDSNGCDNDKLLVDYSIGLSGEPEHMVVDVDNNIIAEYVTRYDELS